jgi:acetyl esterase
MRWFRDHYTREPTNPLVSPLLVPDLAGLPPALVVTADHDPLRHEGEAYADRLRAAGVDAVTSRYVATVHPFTALASVFPDAHAAFVEEAGWALRDALGLGLTRAGAQEVAVDEGDEPFDRVDDVPGAD